MKRRKTLEQDPNVFVVIPAHGNRRKDVIDNIRSIIGGSYKNYTILLIDQANTDGTSRSVSRNFPKVRIVKNKKNTGATGGKNQGIALMPSEARYILFLDSDFVADNQAISELVNAVDGRPEFGAATAKILYFHHPKRVQYAGSRVGLITSINYSNSGIDDGRFDVPKETEGAGGAVLVKRSVVEKVGRFDENFWPVYYEDTDYSYRIREAGYKILYVPTSRFYHKAPFQTTESWLNNAYLTARNKLIFMKKHSSNLLLFFLIYPVFPVFYSFTSLRFRRFDAFRNYWRGIRDGFMRFVVSSRQVEL